MANKLFGNIYYLDTSAADLSAFHAKISTIALWSEGTGGNLVLCHAADTSNVVAILQSKQASANNEYITFDDGLNVSETLRVKALSGTAWIYLV